jgi:hypothetical protein
MKGGDGRELVGSKEIADRLGLNHAEVVINWHHRYEDFPEPVARLSIGYVWEWADVEKWARATGRLPKKKRGTPRG